MPQLTPGPDTTRSLRDALGRFATGVTVVTTQGDAGPLGITANSFASVSLDPPLVLWSPAKASARAAGFERASHYAIHVLGADQMALARRFAARADDFAGLDWQPGAEGVPLIDGCLARFECRQEQLIDAGDHRIILGRVLRAEWSDGAPLLFFGGAYGKFKG